MRSLAAAAMLLLLLLTACENDDTSPVAKPVTSTGTGADTSATPAPAPTDKGSGTPKTDPCDLLTKGMAEAALGLPVGPSTTTPGEGNLTCSYSPSDGPSNVFVILTTYTASGEAALATATQAFPDAKSVPDLGDAALVSRQGHAIGVSVGDLLFGMSLVRADAFTVDPAVAEAQLITLAQTVVRSR